MDKNGIERIVNGRQRVLRRDQHGMDSRLHALSVAAGYRQELNAAAHLLCIGHVPGSDAPDALHMDVL